MFDDRSFVTWIASVEAVCFTHIFFDPDFVDEKAIILPSGE
jgi:hypothetical protein